MKTFLTAIMLIGTTTFGMNISPKIQVKENVEDTQFCGECTEIEVTSTGAIADTMGDALGRYSLAGDFFENILPYFKSSTSDLYLTISPDSNPIMYYVQWNIAKEFTGYNNLIRNSKHTNGINCPWDLPSDWEYLTVDGQWEVDPTFKINCASRK